jgi:hypothetical protein
VQERRPLVMMEKTFLWLKKRLLYISGGFCLVLLALFLVTVGLSADKPLAVFFFNLKNDGFGNEAGAIGALFCGTLTAATVVLLLTQIYEQRLALDRQMENATLQARLTANSAMVEAQNHKIAEAKAIIELLLKGEDVPLERQPAPSRRELFESYAASLKKMIKEPEHHALAVEQLEQWRSSAEQRDDAIESLEQLSRDATRSAAGFV